MEYKFDKNSEHNSQYTSGVLVYQKLKAQQSAHKWSKILSIQSSEVSTQVVYKFDKKS